MREFFYLKTDSYNLYKVSDGLYLSSKIQSLKEKFFPFNMKSLCILIRFFQATNIFISAKKIKTISKANKMPNSSNVISVSEPTRPY